MTIVEARSDRAQAVADQEWVDVCALDDLVPGRGVCALVGADPVAIFRCSRLAAAGEDDELFALSNVDPFSGASVLSRGIVGSIADRPVVASPLFKHRFDLRTGASLDDSAVAVRVWPIRNVGDRVVVRLAQDVSHAAE